MEYVTKRSAPFARRRELVEGQLRWRDEDEDEHEDEDEDDASSRE